MSGYLIQMPMTRSHLALTELRDATSDDSIINEATSQNYQDFHAIVAEEDIGQFYRTARELSLDTDMERYNAGYLDGHLRMTGETLEE